MKDYATLIKAASYLMHREQFSTIRSLVLKGSDLVIQEDTGIPIRFFDKDTWDITLFGKYTKPIAQFQIRQQPDLAEMFADTTIKPLPFIIGYHGTAKESHVIKASKRKHP
jgi:hypothetical protein